MIGAFSRLFYQISYQEKREMSVRMMTPAGVLQNPAV
jgi:hypothetical protein